MDGESRGVGGEAPQKRQADLVLEGGGVKGIAHVGAITALAAAGYEFPRVAGASAGAIAAAFTAARVPPERMHELMTSGLDYRKVPDPDWLGRVPMAGAPLAIVFEKGVFQGDYLHRWIRDTLRAEAGVERWGDLRLEDADSSLSPAQAYRLVVMVTDVSRGALVRLPWDYEVYGKDPDEQPVADAIRASASMPFVFRPVPFRWEPPSQNTSWLVDGGACSDFPVEVFDRTDGKAPRWPTFGVKLQARPDPGKLLNEFDTTLGFAEALLQTVINGNDQVHLSDPCVLERTIFVDTSFVSSTNFQLSTNEQRELFRRGQDAAGQFLQSWDWDAYLRSPCATDPGRPRKAQAAQGGWGAT
jgi:NTE family protein